MVRTVLFWMLSWKSATIAVSPVTWPTRSAGMPRAISARSQGASLSPGALPTGERSPTRK